ncbi:glycosyl transferase family group 2-domain-containing protein [Dactylonectria estremocensis]|uniref:Glycosyl transferase family group 2-domain-containing protein n=1 Tax=Dactylonectria estremocensis TaxID=1079267 RepID=A0A9P9J2T6_9HYPO|nr:glycosyl transferase family group 2-domain-containing protein [Dactylonectria estremocensis]
MASSSEKRESRFRESVPPSPSADAQTLKKLEGGGYFPSLSPHHYRSRSGFSSSEGTPAMTTEVKEPALVAKYIARRATLLGWFDELPAASITSGWSATCVAIKQTDGTYTYAPDDPSPNLVAAVARLDENAVVSMASEVTNTVLDTIKPDQNSLLVESTGARIPVIPSLADIHQSLVYSASSCIVAEERCVLIWSNDPNTIIGVAHNVEKQLLGFIVGPSMPRGLLAQTEEQSIDGQPTPVRGAIDEKNEVYQAAIKVEEGVDDVDEDLEGNPPVRPTLRVHSFRIGIVMILVILTQSMGVSKLLRQWAWDGDYLRFTLVAVIPPLCLLSLFFFIVVVSSVFQLLLPAGMCLRNSKYHSAVKPNRKRYVNYELPHITVQMPVYKEGLRGVVVPTMVSVMAAIQYYENQGGTASVFINDDGMQCIQPELAAARKQYYRENGIGYCARMPNMKTSKSGGFLSWFKRSPPLDPEVDNQDESELSPQGRANKLGFVRKGKFKKASNMNYCLSFSNRVEDELHRLTELECQGRNCSYDELTAEDDDMIYETALQNMLDADEGKTWAEGNIRMGEIILIIDCDTRVPVDCLLYGALEMHESPEVAILQHGSGVMQVAHNIFENGITYFTNIVYTAIKYGVGTGDVAPFVGHNAFLRWKAIQSVSFVDPSDGITKWWSDSHVSEDFDISLRVQMAGMACRLATYHNGGFEEGVSLTVYDELNRWEKYAYGCNELVFHPFYQWIYKGPVTRLFLRFLWSNMPVSSKVSIIAYIFTYYAIAAGMLLTIVNYVLVGLFFADLDHFYTPSWGIWVSLLVVFNGVASVSFSMTRHRLKEKSFWVTIIETVTWLPFLLLFFGGISINCAKALLCHALSVNIEWASTSKELGPTGIYIGLNKMMHRFKYTFLICIVISAGMIYMAVGAPWGWTIAPAQYSTGTYAIVPLAVQVACSFALPLFLGLT